MDKFKDMRILYEEETVNEDTIQIRKLEMNIYNKKGNKWLIFLSVFMLISLFLHFSNVTMIQFEQTGSTAETTTATFNITPISYVKASLEGLFLSEEDILMNQTYINTCADGITEGADNTVSCYGDSKALSYFILQEFKGYTYIALNTAIIVSMLLLVVGPITIIIRAFKQIESEVNTDYSFRKYSYLIPLFGIMIFISTTLHSNLYGLSTNDSLGIGAILYGVFAFSTVIVSLYKNRLGIDPTRKVAKLDTEMKTTLINLIAIIIAFTLLMFPVFKVVINTKGLAIGGEYQSYMYVNEKFSYTSKNKDFDITTIKSLRSRLGAAYFNVDFNEYQDELETFSEGSGWIEVLYQSDIDNHFLIRVMANTSYFASRVLIFAFIIGIINIYGGAFYGRGRISSSTSMIIIFSGITYVLINFINKALFIFTGNGLEDSAFLYNTSLSSYFIIINLIFIVFYSSLSSNQSRIISSYNPMYN